MTADELDRRRSQVRAAQARYIRAHPEKVRTSKAAHYRKNRERLIAKNAAWSRANKDKHANYASRRRAAKANAAGEGISSAVRADILASGLGVCVYCGARAKLTLDHIEPLRLGGAHDAENAAAACHRCNAAKSDTPLLIWLSRRSLARRFG